MSKALIIFLAIVTVSLIGISLVLWDIISDYKQDTKELEKWRKDFRDKYHYEKQD